MATASLDSRPADTLNGLTNGDHGASRPGKRKWEDYTSNDTSADGTHQPYDFLTSLCEILTGLASDTQYGALLNHPFEQVDANSQALKRAKSNKPVKKSVKTVLEKLSASEYSTVDSVLDDLNAAAKGTPESNEGADIVNPDLEKSLDNLVRRIDELQYLDKLHPLNRLKKEDQETKEVVETEDEKPKLDAQPTRSGKSVLTLYGGQPAPRQLFTSAPTSQDVIDPARTTALSAQLPNGISITNVLPLRKETTEQKGVKKATLKEIAPLASSVAELPQPKTSDESKGTAGWLSFTDELPVQKSMPKRFNDQQLSAGSWLLYGEGGKKEQKHAPTFTSSNEAQETYLKQTFSDAIASNQAQATKLDRLMKKAYTSFAPAYDDSNAVIPNSTRNRAWWHKRGHEIWSQACAETTENPFETVNKGEDIVLSEAELKMAIANFEPPSSSLIDPRLQDTTDQAMDLEKERSTDELLQEISALLETLQVYQNIRFRNTKSTSHEDSAPGEIEIDAYKMLEDQLKVMIATLPPYAIAKLNADQMSKLGVSTMIAMRQPDLPGQIEDVTKPTPAATTPAPVQPASTPVQQRPASRVSTLPPPPSTQPVRGGQTVMRANPTNYGVGGNRATPQYTATPPARGYGTHIMGTGARSNYGASSSNVNGYSYNSNTNYGTSATQSPMNSNMSRPNNYPRPVQGTYGTTRSASSLSTYNNYGTSYRPPISTNQPNGLGVNTRMSPGMNMPDKGTPVSSTPGTVGSAIQMTAEEQEMLMARQKAQLNQTQGQNSTSGPIANGTS